MTVTLLLEQLVGWAAGRPDIVAVALVGSYARGMAKPSSDVDLLILATDPHPYLGDWTWIEQFGVVRARQREEYGRVTSLRTLYEGGLEVEFGLTDERWAAQPLDPGAARVIADGMLVLYERVPLLSVLVPRSR